jgi:gliding motility-associated-like protein
MRLKKTGFKLLLLLLFISISPFITKAATFSFNKLYKGTGSSYGLNTQSIVGLSPIAGTSIQFYQAGAQFSGNSINGTLTYYDNNNQLQTIYGNLNRQDKSGNVSQSFYFIVSNAAYTSFTGEAYLFIVPGKESVYSTGATVTTSSDPMAAALNAVVASLNSISLSSASGTDGQTVCKSSAITNITYTTTGATGATFSGLPTGVTGSWASNRVTISGTPSVTGTFNYTVKLTGGSGSGTSTGSITVNPTNTVSLSSAAGTDAQTPNVNSAITNITYTTTGATGASVTGLPAGVTGSWSSNTYTISGTPTASGTFNYTITLTGGCGVVTKTGSITVNPAGSNSIVLSSALGTDAQSFCNGSALTNITYNITGATGATFTGLPTGVTGTWSSNVITITGTPSVTGTFNYTITLTGGVGTVKKTGSIVVSANNTIALSSASGTDAQTPIVGNAITDITYSTTGATGATVTGLPTGVTGSWSSDVFTITGTPTGSVSNTTVYNYTITLTGGCGVVTKAGHIDVNPAGSNTIVLSSATGTDAQTICSNSSITNITYSTTGATGATITGLPAGITGAWASNVVTITGTPSATITSSTTYSYKVSLTGGIGTVETNGTITINPASVAGTIGGSTSICSNNATNTTALSLTGSAGTIQWRSSTDNSNYYDIAGANSSTYNATNVTVTTYYNAAVTNNSCSTVTSGTVSITVVPASVAGSIAGGNVSVCSGSSNSTTLTLSGYTGTIQWQSSTNNSTFTNITGATSATYTASNVNTTTYYRAVVINGACSSDITSSVSITASQCIVANPDNNSTSVKVPVSGNVSTNDKISSGTNYGTPAPLTSNPTGATITINEVTGNYTFTGILPGKYSYYIPVCASGQTTGCVTSLLQITVLDPTIPNNAPVANSDLATTNLNTAVTTTILSNDKSGNIGTILNPSSVSIVLQPLNGTVVVNTNGSLTYTPTNGFTGTDSLLYNICDNATPANCATTYVYYTVLASGAASETTAADDYAYVSNNKTGTASVSGNVLTNDKNTANSALTASIITTPTATQGKITFNTDGTFTFVPTLGFSGPVDVVYNACTSDITPSCAKATLHIIVNPPPTINPDFNSTNVNTPVPGSINTNDVIPAGTNYGTPSPSSKNPTGATLTLNATTGTYTFTASKPGKYIYMISVCAASQTTGCPLSPLEITVLDPNRTDNPPVANNDYSTTQLNTPVTTLILSNDKPGNKNTVLDVTSITINTNPKNGTAKTDIKSITTASQSTKSNSTTVHIGSIIYTPNTDFAGLDSLVYTVCDNASPSNCEVATVYYTISTSSVTNVLVANDDYNSSINRTPATGNVLTNDDYGGATLTAALVTGPTASQGILVFNADGTYIFTPTLGFSGPVDIIYQACSGTTCVNATLHILVQLFPPDPPVVKNATYVAGNSSNPINVKSLVTSTPTGTTLKWCDPTGTTCTSTPPLIPNTPGTYIWCVKSVDSVTLLSSTCAMDTVIIIAPYSIMDISKSATSVKLNPDGSSLVTFVMKATNKTDASLDSVYIKDDLSKTFNTTKGITVYSLDVFGGLVKNYGYDGIANIDLVSAASKIASKKTDSLILKVLIESPDVNGNLINIATLSGKSKYGKLSVASNDPVLNPSDSTRRTPTGFEIPKADIIIAGGFSPNQDGMNDKWIIVRPFGTTISVKVFNRWGNIVFGDDNYKHDWDGRGQGNFIGDYVPEGTYFYMVDAIDANGNVKKFAKTLTIVR